MVQPPPRYRLATPDAPGAIAIVEVRGAGAADAVEQLAGLRPERRPRLADLAGLDEGLVVALRDDWCQVMPHGGVRVVHRLLDRLDEMGLTPEGDDAAAAYPEAASPIEADMLATLARAASPAAIDLLLAQPAAWREAVASGARGVAAQASGARRALDWLVDPPTVVVVGRANVGKSTLTNLVMGRSASVVADLPGTTRDWVGGLAELATPLGGLAVKWFDTPGLRVSDDPIEREAIGLARQVAASAEVLIAMTDPEAGWPEGAALPREPDVWLVNKGDLLGWGAAPSRPGGGEPVVIAAGRGEGLNRVGEAAAGALGLAAVEAGGLWAFSETLRRACDGSVEDDALAAYVGL